MKMAIQIAGTNVVDNTRNLVNITNATSAATGNTFVLRDANGYLYSVYSNQSSPNGENPSISQVMVTNGSDNFLRKASISHLAAAIAQTGQVSGGEAFSAF